MSKEQLEIDHKAARAVPQSEPVTEMELIRWGTPDWCVSWRFTQPNGGGGEPYGVSSYRLVPVGTKVKLYTHPAQEGMVLVPREPTEAMINAAWNYMSANDTENTTVKERYCGIYRAMIDAAMKEQK